jgi:hypothetical protein
MGQKQTFYFIVNLLSGFGHFKILNLVTVCALSSAAVLKYCFSKQFILSMNDAFREELKTRKITYFTIIMLALFFSFAIPDPFTLFVLKKIYITKFVPMVWHNSTTIFLFPFAILLFWKQLQTFNTSRKSTHWDYLALNTLVIVNLLIKPSFIFAYAPVTFFFLVIDIRGESFKKILLKLSPLITAAVIILTQFYLIFMKQEGSFYNEPSTLALSTPFQFFTNFVPLWFIPFSILLSFALPLYTLITHNEIMWYAPFRFALALTIFGILISAFIIELGPRMFHGNFLWQNVICTYLLFLSTVSYLIPKFINTNKKTLSDKVIVGLFVVHAFSGILYLIKFVVTTSYY